MTKEKHPQHCIVFVCHSGELAVKSMLLATSLRHNIGFEAELIAAIPNFINQRDALCDNTLSLIDELSIRTVKIENRISKKYLIGNKVACLGVKTNAEKIIFLDSDILCLRNFPKEIFPGPINLKPADLHTASRSLDDWRYIYSLFNLSLPKRRVVATITGELMLPYFNAGVIAINNGIDLYPTWEECCRQLHNDPSVTDKYPHLDQIALPVAIERLGLEFYSLREELNYPAHIRLLADNLPVLCHYHWPSVVRREPVLNSLVLQLIEKHSSLRGLLSSANQDWQNLLKPSRLIYNTTTSKNKFGFSIRKRKIDNVQVTNSLYPELIITGIPRSGTSLLCRIMDETPNTVIINEPKEIFGPLTFGDPPLWLASYYRELRLKILDGCEIENKVIAGRLIEDTRDIDQRKMYCPTVHDAGFVLGTKNTLAYLARIPLIRNAMPNAPIVACIRDPFDTIASWKSSFAHLANVDFGTFPVSYTNNPFLTGIEKQRLDEISNCKDLAIRRALLWRHLAGVIKENSDRICIIRYEDLIDNPITQIENISIALGNPNYIKPVNQQLSLRSKRDTLNDDDYHAINDVCSEIMGIFGYQV